MKEGVLNIDVTTSLITKELLPQFAYEIISSIGHFCDEIPKEDFEIYFHGTNPRITITALSATGNYKYQSTTDYVTCVEVGNDQISFEEWASAANAGFR